MRDVVSKSNSPIESYIGADNYTRPNQGFKTDRTDRGIPSSNILDSIMFQSILNSDKMLKERFNETISSDKTMNRPSTKTKGRARLDELRRMREKAMPIDLRVQQGRKALEEANQIFSDLKSSSCVKFDADIAVNLVEGLLNDR